MTSWAVTAGCILVAIGAASCSGGSDGAAPSTTAARPSATTTAPERPASTTTTAYDPAAVEGQVEAAYLRSWDVYADAVYNLELDESALAEVYAGDYLDTVRTEIEGRISAGRAAHVRVDHNYSIQFSGPDAATVVDRYRNHQVLIDPMSKDPIEPDPDEEVIDVVTMTRLDGAWRVTYVEELQ